MASEGESSSGALSQPRQKRAAAERQNEKVRAALNFKEPPPFSAPTQSAPPVDVETQKRKVAAEPTLYTKKRKQPGTGPVGLLEYLESDRQIPHSILPNGEKGPKRPFSAPLLFLLKIQDRIQQPADGKPPWTPAQLAKGVSRIYADLPPAKRQECEDEAATALSSFHHDYRSRATATIKAAEALDAECGRGRAGQAFRMFDKNNRARMSHLHPTAAASDIAKLMKKEWQSLPQEKRKPFFFLADRERERARAQQSFWARSTLDASQQFSEDAGDVARDFVTLVPQYCVYCGKALMHEDPKQCRACGRVYQHTIVAFAVGRVGGGKIQAADEDVDIDIEA